MPRDVRHRRTGIFVVLLLAGSTACAVSAQPAKGPPSHGAPDAGASPAERNLVLDETAYWRHYFSFAPPSVLADKIKNEAARFLDQKSLKRAEKQARAQMKETGMEADDWTEHVIVPASSNQYSFADLNVELLARLRTGLPPAAWMETGFDDGDWPRQRGIFSATRQVRRAFFRTRFELPDPLPTTPLRLEATYRGGIRVLLNGKEVAHGHLPQGELDPEIGGGEYPAVAYHLLPGEFLEDLYHLQGYHAGYWKKVHGYVLAPEFPASFEKIQPIAAHLLRNPPPEFRDAGNSCTVNKAGWQRIGRLRDRRLEVDLPPAALRRGENVLAVEVRASPVHPLGLEWEEAYVRNCSWRHGSLEHITLRSRDARVVSTLHRRPGAQVWVEDIHRRVYAADFCELTHPAPKARIVAARNGTFAAQIVLGTERDLSRPTATIGRFLRRDNGSAAVPPPPAAAPAARVFYPVPHTIQEMQVGDAGRRLGNGFDFNIYAGFVTAHYGKPDVPFFDHLAAEPPASLPANSSYPFWVSLQVPRGAAPGVYEAAVTVEAEGMVAVEVPLQLEVLDWRLPDPKDFQTLMALEESPYAVADHYQAPPWSDAHFKLLEKTFASLARVHNGWLNIPVLMNTEFGNREDSPLLITHKKDGSYAFDFTAVDRYLDLAIRHCGKPQVVNFIVMHAGNPGDNRMALSPVEVRVRDEQTGKLERLRVDSKMAAEAKRVFWKRLATTIYDHMKRRGLGDVTYWGYTWDGPGADPSLYAMLDEFAPGVHWTKGSHSHGPNENKYTKAAATAYNSQVGIWFTSKKGWKNPLLWLAYPRYWGTIIDCSDYSPPFCFRMMTERALASGARGIGRVGTDYWGDVYLRGHVATYAVGVPNLFLLFPGKDGAETSMRYELLCEGLQETEARIFLERACEKLSAPEHKEFVERATALLDERLLETMVDSPAMSNPELAELCGKGWQDRSRRLYQTAVEAARILGGDASLSITPQ
ncbi:MAG: glycoside hydrolase domain-containing protein [Thermoguttaceae bacterium]|jgi:hypothetical protein